MRTHSLVFALCLVTTGCGLLDKLKKKQDAPTDDTTASTSTATATSTATTTADPTASGPAAIAPVANAKRAPVPVKDAGADASVTATTDAGATAAGTYKVGDKLNVEWKGVTYPATVIGVPGPNQYKIHYDGYAASWDEVVGPSRIKGRR